MYPLLCRGYTLAGFEPMHRFGVRDVRRLYHNSNGPLSLACPLQKVKPRGTPGQTPHGGRGEGWRAHPLLCPPPLCKVPCCQRQTGAYSIARTWCGGGRRGRARFQRPLSSRDGSRLLLPHCNNESPMTPHDPTPSRRALPRQVHVMDAVIDVSCGEGTNTVRWMAHVAIAMYDRAGCKGYLQLGACQCDD